MGVSKPWGAMLACLDLIGLMLGKAETFLVKLQASVQQPPVINGMDVAL